MVKLFLTVLNMSLTGAFVIVAICLARLPLRKAPRIISYCLWAVAGFRLVFPFSVESKASLIPFDAQPIPPDIAMRALSRVDSGVTIVNDALPATTQAVTVNALQNWSSIATTAWFIGVAVMCVYGVVSYFILKRKVRTSCCYEENIYEAKNIETPFVLGVFAPNIYLPIGLSEQERGFIILHEQTHIKRLDHIVKLTAYFILCLHWFNPLAWVAFLLLGVDMEMSCDERVLQEIGGEAKRDYSLTLLSLATEHRIIGGSPLAFGEGGVQQRVKNILNFGKPSQAVKVAAAVLAIALSAGFAVNRIRVSEETSWELYSFPYSSYHDPEVLLSPYVALNFRTDVGGYLPPAQVINANLANYSVGEDLVCSETFTLVKFVEDGWRIVPFSGGIKQDDTSFTLRSGRTKTYTVSSDMVATELTSGFYRIVTEVSYRRASGLPLTVWAEFLIDEDADTSGYVMYALIDPVWQTRQIVDSVTILAWKDAYGLTNLILHNGEALPSPMQLSPLHNRLFNSVELLNDALSTYPQDSLSMVYLKHTKDFPLDEINTIKRMLAVPSKEYGVTLELYTHSFITLYEAIGIVRTYYPVTKDIRHTGEGGFGGSLISVEAAYLFEVDSDGDTIERAVSVDQGELFERRYDKWVSVG